MPGSSLEDVLLVNPFRIRPATADEIVQAESELGTQLPSGYAAYVERLGEGVLGHFVRVYAPAEVPDLTLEWRERIRAYWFWDTTEAGVLPVSLQERGVVLADSFDGDELCFDPSDPETLFVLPRHEDVVRRVGPGFVVAVDWMLSGGLNPWVEGWTFEAGVHRAEVRQTLHGRRLPEAARAIAALGQHSHVVSLDNRRTFFLPAIGGRLSLYQFDDGAARVDLTYDEAADPQALGSVLAAMEGA